MGSPFVDDAAFIKIWRETGGRAKQVEAILGYSCIRPVMLRRASIEKRHDIVLVAAGDNPNVGRGDAGITPDYLQRLIIDGFAGTIVVFSDAHYWPGQGPTIAHTALLKVIRRLKPAIVVGNGDLFDGARLSRFPPQGWEQTPRVYDELTEAMDRLAEVRGAFKGAEFIRTIGNHDIRFDRYIASHAQNVEDVPGTRLRDHLPEWQECMSVFVNGHTMIKHRIHGGIHAAFNNTLRAGTSVVTGHTHHLEIKPWSDYRGRRYGVQTGAIADVQGPQFSYTEDNPNPWCSGFAVLTFDPKGRLLYPELAEVIDDQCYFRGRVVA